MDSIMKRKIRGRLVAAIANATGYQMLIKEAQERFENYKGYPNCMKLTMCFFGDINFKYHHKNWPDEHKEITIKVGLQPTFVIKPNFADDFIKDLKINLARMLADQLLNACEFKELHHFYVVESISFDDVYDRGTDAVSPHHYWSEMIVWSSDNVSIWHVEQECGEHWITLPLNPNMLQCTVVYNKV